MATVSRAGDLYDRAEQESVSVASRSVRGRCLYQLGYVSLSPVKLNPGKGGRTTLFQGETTGVNVET